MLETCRNTRHDTRHVSKTPEMLGSGPEADLQKLRNVAECCLKKLRGVTSPLVGAPTTKPTASLFIPESKQYAADVSLELHGNSVFARLVACARGRMPVERVYLMGLANTLCRGAK
jgi:hypothetical protein